MATAATLNRLFELGLAHEVIVEIVALFERDEALRNALRHPLRNALRSPGAERQARYRENRKKTNGVAALEATIDGRNESVTRDVTERNATPLSTSSSELVVKHRGNQGKELQPELVEGRKRGSRLDDDWRPSDADMAYARKHGLTESQIEIEATKFRNYWTNRTDRASRKPRWDRAWQNWILNVRGGNGYRGSRPLQDDSKSVSRAAEKLAEAAERGEFTIGPIPSLLPQPSEDSVLLLPKGRGS